MPRNSDRRKIKDVQNITGPLALEKIQALQPVLYRHIDEEPGKPEYMGFIAQDFASVFPALIRKRKNDDGKGPIKDPSFERPRPPAGPPELPSGTAGSGPGPLPGTGTTTPPNPGTGGNPNPGTGGTTPNPSPGGQPAGPRTLAAFFTDEPIPAPLADPVAAPAPSPSQPAAEEPLDDISNVGGYSITSYEELIPILVGAVKELTAINSTLRQKVDELEKKVQKLMPSLQG